MGLMIESEKAVTEQQTPGTIVLDGCEVTYLPKRNLSVPVPANIDDKDKPLADFIRGYLDGQPVYISGNTEAFYKQHPELQINNQFRGNIITKPVLAMQLLAVCLDKKGNGFVADRLRDISRDIREKVYGIDSGKPYSSMTQIDEKLEVVHFVEDSVVKALEILAR